jgi:knotted carbamoyltransferase YgeW
MNDDTFKKLLKEIKWLDADLFEKDFLLTWEKSINELKQILYVAEALKVLQDNNISTRCFDSGLAVSLSRNKSSQTRLFFASAANLLGLTVQELDESNSHITQDETVRETINMISFLTDILGICDYMCQGAGNTYMREVAEALDDGFKKGVLPQRPGIVNLQSDMDHPTQAMAGLLHLKNHFGSLERLKGKKMAATWVYSPNFGKPLSVPQGIIGLMTRFGMKVTLAHPKGYNLLPEVIDIAKKNAAESDGNFEVVHSLDEAFEDSDIVIAVNWTPYPVLEKRTTLLRNNDHAGLKKLEQACLEQNAKHKDWVYTGEKMTLKKEEEALYMPYIIASMVLNNRFPDPARVLEALRKRNIKRTI